MSKVNVKDTSIDDLATDFIVENASYYQAAFAKIQRAEGLVFSWNTIAALFRPLRGALRGVWFFFWVFIVLELFALVQIGRDLWGELGGDKLARYEWLMANIAKREDQARTL
ncbi:hypothetical protein OAL97_01175 [Paracoccaceae bacterium]|jgi:glycine betaine/proline transport system permease protein|nr:hypothetical protein [Paracoccaceae bacterium]